MRYLELQIPIKLLNLNADLGESWYDNIVGNDEQLMPLLDSCNIACGIHGGDALTMKRTIGLALKHNVAIGAHPSFPDRKNFGRVSMELPMEQLEAFLLYQVSALQGMVEAQGGKLHHIKPHGALYHYLNETPEAAGALIRIAKAKDVGLVYGPPTGTLRTAAESAGLNFWPEGFADRRYEPTLHLRSRLKKNASIHDPADAVAQVRLMATEQAVIAIDGNKYPLHVKTVCIHGDHEGALQKAQAIRQFLNELR